MTIHRGLDLTLPATLLLLAVAPLPATAQDPMEHVDMSSDEMSVAEMSREQLVGMLANDNGTGRPDLTSRRLSGLDLSNVDFRGANLRWARLNGTNLSGANLSDTILDSAWLVDADLRDANLQHARLSSSQLRRANLQRADLSSARIVANFQRADLREAILRDADLSADMRNQSMGLMRTVFRLAKLEGADLSDVRGHKLNAEFASLRNARLDGADFSGADLTGADLTGASVAGLDLSDADLAGATLVALEGKEALTGLELARNADEAQFD